MNTGSVGLFAIFYKLMKGCCEILVPQYPFPKAMKKKNSVYSSGKKRNEKEKDIFLTICNS